MICPNCKAEFREGFRVCSDCDVPLVYALPQQSVSAHSNESGRTFGDTEDDIADERLGIFWQGDDPRLQGEICAILEEQRIPYKTLRREEFLFRFTAKSAFTIGIPVEMFDKAEKAIQEAYGASDAASGLVPELPETAGDNGERSVRDTESWYPEDATVEIWSGEFAEDAEMIVASLRENQIHTRRETASNSSQRVLVIPEDTNRAKQIVQQILNNWKPE